MIRKVYEETGDAIMAKYHINAKGEPGACSAKSGNCPFGTEDDHYTTPEAARKAYEQLSSDKMYSDPKEVAKNFGIGTAATAGYTLAGYTTARLEKTSLRLKGEALSRVKEELKRRGFGSKAENKNNTPQVQKAKNTSNSRDPIASKDFSEMILKTIPDPNDSKLIEKPKTVENTGGSWKFVGGGGKASQSEAASNIRAAIKNAKAQGELPSWLDVSVRKNNGAWVTSISVTVGMRRKIDGKVRMIPVDWLYEPDRTDPSTGYYPRRELTPAGQRLSDYISSISRQWESSYGDIYDNYNSWNSPRVTWRDKYEDKVADEAAAKKAFG